MAIKKQDANANNNPIMMQAKDSKFNFFHTLPSVQKDTEKLQDYALRQSLNIMQPQMQKYKLRKGL